MNVGFCMKCGNEFEKKQATNCPKCFPVFKRDEWVKVRYGSHDFNAVFVGKNEDNAKYLVDLYSTHKNKFFERWIDKSEVKKLQLEKFENSKQDLIDLALDLKDETWFVELTSGKVVK